MEIKNYQIDGIYKQDYPDYPDAYLSYAEDENGNKLSEEQLDVWVEENKDEFYDIILQYAYNNS